MVVLFKNKCSKYILWYILIVHALVHSKYIFINCSSPDKDLKPLFSQEKRNPSEWRNKSESPRKKIKKTKYTEEKIWKESNYKLSEEINDVHVMITQENKKTQNILSNQNGLSTIPNQNQKRTNSVLTEITETPKKKKGKTKHLEEFIQKEQNDTTLFDMHRHTDKDSEKYINYSNEHYDMLAIMFHLGNVAPDLCKCLLSNEPSELEENEFNNTGIKINSSYETNEKVEKTEQLRINVLKELQLPCHKENKEENQNVISSNCSLESDKNESEPQNEKGTNEISQTKENNESENEKEKENMEINTRGNIEKYDNDHDHDNDDEINKPTQSLFHQECMRKAEHFLNLIVQSMEKEQFSEGLLRNIINIYIQELTDCHLGKYLFNEKLYQRLRFTLSVFLDELNDYKASTCLSNGISNVWNLLESLFFLKFILYKFITIDQIVYNYNCQCKHISMHNSFKMLSFSSSKSPRDKREHMEDIIETTISRNKLLRNKLKDILVSLIGINGSNDSEYFSKLVAANFHSLLEDFNNIQKNLTIMQEWIYIYENRTDISYKHNVYKKFFNFLENSKEAVSCLNIIKNYIQNMKTTVIDDMKQKFKEGSLLNTIYYELEAAVQQEFIYSYQNTNVQNKENIIIPIKDIYQYFKSVERILEETNLAHFSENNEMNSNKELERPNVDALYIITKFSIIQIMWVQIKEIEFLFLKLDKLISSVNHQKNEESLIYSKNELMRIFRNITLKRALFSDIIRKIKEIILLMNQSVLFKRTLGKINETSKELSDLMVKNMKDHNALDAWKNDALVSFNNIFTLIESFQENFKKP